MPMQMPALPASPPGPRLSILPRTHIPVSSLVPFPGPRTCKELLTQGHFLSGWYTIFLPNCQPLSVLCDMHTDNGGWTVNVSLLGSSGKGSGAEDSGLMGR